MVSEKELIIASEWEYRPILAADKWQLPGEWLGPLFDQYQPNDLANVLRRSVETATLSDHSRLDPKRQIQAFNFALRHRRIFWPGFQCAPILLDGR